jgi:hypothetical protein
MKPIIHETYFSCNRKHLEGVAETTEALLEWARKRNEVQLVIGAGNWTDMREAMQAAMKNRIPADVPNPWRAICGCMQLLYYCVLSQ